VKERIVEGSYIPPKSSLPPPPPPTEWTQASVTRMIVDSAVDSIRPSMGEHRAEPVGTVTWCATPPRGRDGYAVTLLDAIQEAAKMLSGHGVDSSGTHVGLRAFVEYFVPLGDDCYWNGNNYVLRLPEPRMSGPIHSSLTIEEGPDWMDRIEVRGNLLPKAWVPVEVFRIPGVAAEIRRVTGLLSDVNQRLAELRHPFHRRIREEGHPFSTDPRQAMEDRINRVINTVAFTDQLEREGIDVIEFQLEWHRYPSYDRLPASLKRAILSGEQELVHEMSAEIADDFNLTQFSYVKSGGADQEGLT
jgi:hypothetical protein